MTWEVGYYQRRGYIGQGTSTFTPRTPIPRNISSILEVPRDREPIIQYYANGMGRPPVAVCDIEETGERYSAWGKDAVKQLAHFLHTELEMNGSIALRGARERLTIARVPLVPYEGDVHINRKPIKPEGTIKVDGIVRYLCRAEGCKNIAGKYGNKHAKWCHTHKRQQRNESLKRHRERQKNGEGLISNSGRKRTVDSSGQ